MNGRPKSLEMLDREIEALGKPPERPARTRLTDLTGAQLTLLYIGDHLADGRTWLAMEAVYDALLDVPAVGTDHLERFKRLMNRRPRGRRRPSHHPGPGDTAA